MTSLTRRGPYANLPARLPGIQTARITDANVRQAVESLREWVEVRLGARGDRFERAVTFRDLVAELNPLLNRLSDIDAILNGLQNLDKSSDLQSVRNAIAALQNQINSLSNGNASDVDLSNIVNLISDLTKKLELCCPETIVIEVDAEDAVVLPDAVPNALYVVSLSADTNVYAPVNAVSGKWYTYIFIQNEVGGWSVTFDFTFKFPVNVSPLVATDSYGVTVLNGFFYAAPTYDAFYVVSFNIYNAASISTASSGVASAAGKAAAQARNALVVGKAVSAGISSATSFRNVPVNEILLLVHADGPNNSTTFVDSSTFNAPLTAQGNARISTVQSKFGGSSATMSDFDGNILVGVAKQLPPQFAGIDESDWTIEGWLYLDPTSTVSQDFYTLIAFNTEDTPPTGTGGFGVQAVKGSTGSWSLGMLSGAGSANNITIGGSSDRYGALGVWTHWAAVRQDGKLRLFVNGKSQIYRAQGLEIYDWIGFGGLVAPDCSLRIGKSYTGRFSKPEETNYIDEIRITKAALYTGSYEPILVVGSGQGVTYRADFTPPAAPFPNP